MIIDALIIFGFGFAIAWSAVGIYNNWIKLYKTYRNLQHSISFLILELNKESKS